MRRGFSLFEMVVLIVVLTAISFALTSVLATLLNDIPQSYGVVQVNTSLLNMLKQMQTDIDSAKQLPESFGEHTASDKLLLIEWPDGCICYELKDSEVVRYTLSDGRQRTAKDATVWSVPNAKVAWNVRQKNGEAYAVEVKTYIEYHVPGHSPQEKMANSHLYFAGAFRGLLK